MGVKVKGADDSYVPIVGQRLLDGRAKYKHRGARRRATLGEALAELAADGRAGAIRKLLARLSKTDRFRVFAELAALPARRGALGPDVVYEGSIAFTKLGPKVGPYARAAASGLVARYGARTPMAVRWPAFAALLAAKIAIEPEWDVLFPVAFHARDDEACTKLVPLMLDALRALPPARRDAAVLGALANEHHDFIRNGRRLLDAWPSAALVRAMLEHAKSHLVWTPRRLAAALRKDHPRLAPVLDALAKGAKPPLVLHRGSTKPITSAKRLTPLEREQIAIAGRRWDGERLDAGARLAKGFAETSLLSLERIELSDGAGTVRYEAFTHSGDSGTVFAAGTKRVVASIVQSGVECSNAALHDALVDALQDA